MPCLLTNSGTPSSNSACVAPIYVLLASQESSFVTGDVYGVTGGRHLPWLGGLRSRPRQRRAICSDKGEHTRAGELTLRKFELAAGIPASPTRGEHVGTDPTESLACARTCIRTRHG
ncbi:hypothetical protein FAZ98_35095 (plasmid) [Paraburkholderia acidisoli]|uniref:Uncharacterized protein n=1 Tax=Paraburkholderia acidisoli TaxID=2571748 RepID=A0A7Z2JIM4_9BURK|nr:hypothetical protein FAZ98_35095 [Paraburkholderia acidisoli]